MGRYQALTNLSVPRKGDVNRETDLVLAGETIDLADDVAALFLPPLRQPAVIRPAKDASQPLERMHPRSLSGVAINQRTGQRVGFPGPGLDARPDPPHSSAVQVLEPPEASEPQPGMETQLPGQDAVDLPPRRSRAGATPKPR